VKFIADIYRKAKISATHFSPTMNPPDIEIRVSGRKILITMPKNEIDIQMIRGIRFSRWNSSLLSWEVPNYPGNLETLMAHFDSRISLMLKDESVPSRQEAKPVLKKNAFCCEALKGFKTFKTFKGLMVQKFKVQKFKVKK
jgi:hypothetical protein